MLLLAGLLSFFSCLALGSAQESEDTGRTISGTVKVRSTPVGNLWLRPSGTRARSMRSDATGHFVLHEVPFEECFLEVYLPLSRGYSRLGEVPLAASRESSELALQLDPVRLDVLLQWPSGAVGWAMRVEVKTLDTEDAVGRTVSWAVTDEHGAATLAVPRKGTYRVTARHADWGRGAAVIDLQGDLEEPLTFPLRTAVPCKGTIVTPGWSSERRRELLLQEVDPGTNSVPEESVHTWIDPYSEEFGFRNALPGRYVAYLFDPVLGVGRSQEFELTEEGSRELILEFEETP